MLLLKDVVVARVAPALLLYVSCSALLVAPAPALLIGPKPALLLGFSLVVKECGWGIPTGSWL